MTIIQRLKNLWQLSAYTTASIADSSGTLLVKNVESTPDIGKPREQKLARIVPVQKVDLFKDDKPT